MLLIQKLMIRIEGVNFLDSIPKDKLYNPFPKIAKIHEIIIGILYDCLINDFVSIIEIIPPIEVQEIINPL